MLKLKASALLPLTSQAKSNKVQSEYHYYTVNQTKIHEPGHTVSLQNAENALKPKKHWSLVQILTT